MAALLRVCAAAPVNETVPVLVLKVPVLVIAVPVPAIESVLVVKPKKQPLLTTNSPARFMLAPNVNPGEAAVFPCVKLLNVFVPEPE